MPSKTTTIRPARRVTKQVIELSKDNRPTKPGRHLWRFSARSGLSLVSIELREKQLWVCGSSFSMPLDSVGDRALWSHPIVGKPEARAKSRGAVI